jgi:hypothetical protein
MFVVNLLNFILSNYFCMVGVSIYPILIILWVWPYLKFIFVNPKFTESSL